MKSSLLLLLLLSAGSVLAQSLPDPTPAAHPRDDAKMDPAAKAKEGSSTAGAIQKGKVFFVEPKNGATVEKTFTVKMGVEGYKVRPAGEAPDEVVSGHHHILIDQGAAPAGQPIPNDDKHMHFGKGQMETKVTLPPGKHTLTLQFADGAHRSFGPQMSQTITVNVK